MIRALGNQVTFRMVAVFCSHVIKIYNLQNWLHEAKWEARFASQSCDSHSNQGRHGHKIKSGHVIWFLKSWNKNCHVIKWRNQVSWTVPSLPAQHIQTVGIPNLNLWWNSFSSLRTLQQFLLQYGIRGLQRVCKWHILVYHQWDIPGWKEIVITWWQSLRVQYNICCCWYFPSRARLGLPSLTLKFQMTAWWFQIFKTSLLFTGCHKGERKAYFCYGTIGNLELLK